MNLTVFADGVALKLLPLMLTAMPALPLVGENEVIDGVTVKFELLFVVVPATVTEINPVVAEGTTTVREVAVADDTVAATPLNLTVLLLGEFGSKLLPLIVTVVPMGPDVGLKLVIAGCGMTKLVLLTAVGPLPPSVNTVIGPVVLPEGTAATT